MDMTFHEIAKDPARKQMNETNDCTVIAVAVVCGIPYEKAHALLKAAGRQNRKGVFTGVYHRIIKEQGFEILPITAGRQNFMNIPTVSAKTVRTVERELAANFGECKIMINIRRHVLTWNGKEIVDWSAGRQHRIQDVYLVYPKGNPPTIGKSVPVPERKKLCKPKMVRSAVNVFDSNNCFIGEYRSVKAAYDDNNWDLRGHQAFRRHVKYWGRADTFVFDRDSYNRQHITMELVDPSTAECNQSAS